jgi:hypothetical protein
VLDEATPRAMQESLALVQIHNHPFKSGQLPAARGGSNAGIKR